ncbi:hypothetical protein KIK06_15515 [Nocardiopsis sp. EMB25]|uniref:hypothetical protein n=1 Tax=Nocardiopsis sp. EMB25 TaxID=2835867 RepID=UPI002283530B|nr:hypothetical protein [Nocardiopsis sp. EMB25]MCY9785291.1 hypothetical protein [Nocardiopsis sp. EMB25]
MRHDPPGPALAASAALLDRSLTQIADAARDTRAFDRGTVRVAADVWDNNTFPLFRAATGRSGNERERRARAALEWMAQLGPERRAWMVEQGAAAGHRIDALLGPEHPPDSGRRVGAPFPLRRSKRHINAPPSRGNLAGSTRGAAVFVARAMIRMRSSRHPREAAGFPLEACCRALDGAGQDILSAGALPRRLREAAFRSLVAEWLRRGGADLEPHWKQLLQGVPDAGELVRGVRGEP